MKLSILLAVTLGVQAIALPAKVVLEGENGITGMYSFSKSQA